MICVYGNSNNYNQRQSGNEAKAYNVFHWLGCFQASRE